jgi:hypothetical protein
VSGYGSAAAKEAIEVNIGRELHELAEGKLTFEEIRARREDEVAVDLE